MKKLILFLIGCFLSFSAQAGFLSDPFSTEKLVAHNESCDSAVDVTKPLTLIEVVSQALCHNPLTRQQWANAKVQAAMLGSSRATYLPTLTGSTAFQHSKSTLYDVQSPGTTILNNGSTVINTANYNQAETILSPVVSLSLLLYDFGGREATIEFTKKSLEAANYTFNATMQQVIFNAVQAYYQYFSAQEELKATLESEKSSNTNYEAAVLRYKNGTAPLADKLQAETAYSQAKLARLQSENNAHIKKGMLANIMALDPDNPFTLEEAHIDKTESHFSDNVNAIIAEAKKHRPDIAASHAQLRSSEVNVEVAKTPYKPRITLDGSRGYTDYTSGGLNNGDNYSIGVNLTLPLFTGFDANYKVRAAKQQYEAQQAATAQVENDGALDVWRSYQNFQTANESLLTTTSLIDSAAESEKEALGRYNAGTGSMIDVVTAQSQLALARQQRIELEYNWFIAKADLVRAMGQLNIMTLRE